jgi:hypothetical protein
MTLVHGLSDGSYREEPDSLRSAFDDFLAEANEGPRPKDSTCCLFISHRMNDVGNALHIAWLATQSGYDYWLDVHDPKLAAANNAPLSSPAQEILIAAIIEIALLNVTHVVAIHTSRSAGSKWIPYELGRAKARLVYSDQAAGWYYPSTLRQSRVEYMHLVRETTTDAEIQGWLSSSRGMCQQKGDCVLTNDRTWKYGAGVPPLVP